MNEDAQTHQRSEIRFGVASAVLAMLITIGGCARNHPVEQTSSVPAPQNEPQVVQPPQPPPAPPAPPPDATREPRTSAPQPLEGSGQTVWAKGFRGLFIAGLDGGLYDPYRAATVERVQRILTNRGLYSGPINGVLDPPTIQSIYAFQQANRNLQMCGIPTPHTRKLLEQGSHTDVGS